MTGYPSIDKPWLKYYSKEAINAPLPEMTMYQYIWENNKDHLSDIALRYYGTKITYGRLFDNIKRAASAFYSMGVRAGDIVTIMSMHTPETIYAIYGLNYIGAVANLVYMTLTEEEIADRLSKTKSKLFLILDVALDRVGQTINNLKIPIIVLSVSDSMPPIMKSLYQLKNRKKKHSYIAYSVFIHKDVSLAPLADNSISTAIIVYTSGTTGEPKGAMLSNDALNAHSCQELYANFGFARKKTFMHILPPFVGFGISHIHLALNAGIDSYLWIELDQDKIAKAFFKIKPNYFVGGPALIDAFLKHHRENLKNLELFVGGGEALADSKEQEFNNYLRQSNTHALYCNGYGMTETSSTLCCSTNTYHKHGSVGLPMPKTIVKIIDPEDGHELRYGEIGELCFQTPNIMSGYYNNSYETDRIMLHDNQGKQWIRTGDLGIVDEDGFVYIKGRIKRIEITMGKDGMAYKLFPLRIEEKILGSDFVEKCAVVILNDELRIHVPVVFVTLHPNHNSNEVNEQSIWQICKEHLSAHEQPVRINILETMPMTPSGKIDYRALEKLVEEKRQ
ncbi:MAG: acyl--CoA ligase [Oscillospiraceae bacterium]|nr:acyl--CoA ligase [Oscillospiraceae bacterium]